ncbi:MAG: hypothetical protein GWO24_35690 [Akkermansiaceae bacterium]|nr:hypothetical protein [Akkermansiaceae bacterium]
MKKPSTKSSIVRRIAPVLVTGVLTALIGTSCKTISGTEETSVYETPDGLVVVEEFKTSGTVTAINPITRKVGLRMQDGSRTTVTCGPEVRNFGQIEVNDRVNISITEEHAVFVGQGNPRRADGESVLARAPLGAKPAGAAFETFQVTSTITAIDPASRKVTLKLPDGSTKTLKAGKRVKLSGLAVGDDVTVLSTRTIAASVAS